MSHDPDDTHKGGPEHRKAVEESAPRYAGALWPSLIAALIVLVTAAAGVVCSLGPHWQLVCNGVTLLAVSWVLWEAHRQRKRRATVIAAHINELLELLSSGHTGLSSAQLWKFEVQLKRLRLEMLRGANLFK